MAGFEIVALEASGEAVFSGFTLKWLSAFKMNKMVTRGRLSIHLQEAPKLSKEWSTGSLYAYLPSSPSEVRQGQLHSPPCMPLRGPVTVILVNVPVTSIPVKSPQVPLQHFIAWAL